MTTTISDEQVTALRKRARLLVSEANDIEQDLRPALFLLAALETEFDWIKEESLWQAKELGFSGPLLDQISKTINAPTMKKEGFHTAHTSLKGRLLVCAILLATAKD